MVAGIVRIEFHHFWTNVESHRLEKRSILFNAALKAPAGTVFDLSMPKLDHIQFDRIQLGGLTSVYVDHLKTRSLVPALAGIARSGPQTKHDKYEVLFLLYLVGHNYGDTLFKDDVMQSIFEVYQQDLLTEEFPVPSAKLIEHVCKHALLDSPLRRFAISMCVRGKAVPKLSVDLEENRWFLHDLSSALYAELPRLQGASNALDAARQSLESYKAAFSSSTLILPEPYFVVHESACDYHEHDEGAKCNSTKRKRAAEDNGAENEERATSVPLMKSPTVVASGQRSTWLEQQFAEDKKKQRSLYPPVEQAQTVEDSDDDENEDGDDDADVNALIADELYRNPQLLEGSLGRKPSKRH